MVRLKNVWITAQVAKNMGPIWLPSGQNSPTIWLPYGLPIWDPDGQTWGPDGAQILHLVSIFHLHHGAHLGPIWFSPYGTHVYHMGPIWDPYGLHVYHMGPIWDPYGTHIGTSGQNEICGQKSWNISVSCMHYTPKPDTDSALISLILIS